MVSAIASIGNFIRIHKTTPASLEFKLLIKKISTTLQQSIDSFEPLSKEEISMEETVENAQETLLEKYQQLANQRDENIRQGNTTLDTETLHGLQESYLIANQMSWLISLSENLKKSTERYRSSIIETH
jgi:hypothetical protein